MRRKADELEVLAAAYLCGQEKVQAEIAKTLGVSQSVVSRLLQQAKTLGWLESKVRFAAEKISSQRMAEIEVRVSPYKLRKQLRRLAEENGAVPPLSIRVCSSGSHA